jgi:hypothetical protein
MAMQALRLQVAERYQRSMLFRFFWLMALLLGFWIGSGLIWVLVPLWVVPTACIMWLLLLASFAAWYTIP